MRLRLAIGPLVVAALVALPAAAPAAKKKCAPKKEEKGCKLPDAQFEGGKAGSAKYALLLVSSSGAHRLQGTVPLACTGGTPGSSSGGTSLFPVDEKLNLPKRLVVGKSYSKRWQFDEVSPDGRTHSVGDYSYTLKVTSAKKVTARFSSSLVQQAAVPEERMNPPRDCKGSSTHTLKRVR